MSDSKKMLDTLRRKVEESKKELEEQENALRIVERMLEASTEEMESAPTAPLEAKQINRDVTKEHIHEASSTGTIVDNVASVLPELGEESYTVSDVYERMRDAGVAPDNKSRISTVLRKFANRKKIELLTQGKGKAPSVYKSVE